MDSEMKKTKISTNPAVRRVYGAVSNRTFENFKYRCEAEGISIGKGFSALIEAYANGAVIVDGNRNKLKEHNDWNYIKEKNDE